MIRKRKRTGQRTIANVFLRYVCRLAGGALLWLLVLFCIFLVLAEAGEILPANYAELWLNEAAEELKEAPEITEEMLPPRCSFGVFRRDGSWLYGTIPGEERRTAWKHYEENMVYTRGHGYYRFVERDSGEVCIVNYEIAMLYRNAFLSTWLPRADVVLVILYVILFLLHTAVVSRSFGRYMQNRISVLNEAAEEIRNQNLEFEKGHSDIREVAEVLDSLFQMKEALKESLHRQWELEESRREQIAALAHDIKTPLTVIRGNAELLAEGELAEEEKEYDRDILQSVEIMEGYLGMLHEILQADRNGTEAGDRQISCEALAGKMEAGDQSIPCEALAGKMEEQARLLASARKSKVMFDREELQGEVPGKESQMIRAFQNIVSNALDYSPPGKAIRIRISNREEQGEMYLAAVVMDEGPGFSAEDLKHAAERFYQGDKSRSSQVHYGIGLHTARQFLEAQGGYLALENGEEGGGKVTLYFVVHSALRTDCTTLCEQ